MRQGHPIKVVAGCLAFLFRSVERIHQRGGVRAGFDRLLQSAYALLGAGQLLLSLLDPSVVMVELVAAASCCTVAALFVEQTADPCVDWAKHHPLG